MTAFMQPAEAEIVNILTAPTYGAMTDAQAILAERKLYYFLRYAWPIIEPGNRFIDSWHIGCLCEHLQAMTELEIQRLVINMPRRRGKSSICSVAWFCWAWIKNPWTRWGFMSYGQDLSMRDSIKCRDIINSKWYQQYWPITMKTDQNAKLYFSNDQQGYRIATSTGGKVVGFGGDYNCCDDPHDYRDAWSPKKLEDDARVWINGVQRSVNDPRTARFLVVMQRLAENDLSGILTRGDHGYQHLCLPEEYEVTRVFMNRNAAKNSKERDPIIKTKIQVERPVVKLGEETIQVADPRKDEGELLSPERYPREIVEQEKKSSAYEYASQNQQRPHPLEGTIIKDTMFRYFRVGWREGRQVFILQVNPDRVRYYPVELCRWFQTIDTALKDNEENDNTACCTFALTPDADLLLYDCFAGKITVPYQMMALDHLLKGKTVWRPETQDFVNLDPWPGPLLFQAIEEAASGVGLIQSGMARGTPFKPLKADGNPMVKIAPIAADYASGKVYHLEAAEWLFDYESEALGFPHAAHDDRLVSAAYGSYLKRHDVILRQHMQRELIVSDREAVLEAEEIRKNRGRDDVLRIATSSGDSYMEFKQ